MIFVDTGIWYAANVMEEPEHQQADALLTAPGTRLVTTDYVIDELLTLLVARRNRPMAKVLGELLFSGAMCEIIWIERPDIEAAWQVFDAFDDKEWSFTDCVRYAVMKRLGISEAYALDEHFKQFGFASVKP
jgi:predicted nucleic acid-binding protein